MLIAEIGNNHFGSMELARELIWQAVDAGADLVKGQIILGPPANRSMPEMFYLECALKENEYIELIEYARSLGSDMFYSLFTSFGFAKVIKHQNFNKISAGQTKALGEQIVTFDEPTNIISINDIEILFPLYEAEILYASNYSNAVNLFNIDYLSKSYSRPVGYSDHTEGIDNCLKAIKKHGAHIIEKHFTIEKNIKYNNTVFRDTVFAATADELCIIANELKEHYGS